MLRSGPAPSLSAWEGESVWEKFRSKLGRTATRLAYRTFPQWATAALEIEAAGLRSRGIPAIFSRGLVQIDPSLNDDLLDLYGRSEQVLANRFTFLNISERFGAEIDWEGHESPGWRCELHAFDYALDLALTYRISREEPYARHLRYLIAQWISANPPGEGSGWRPAPLARRMRNWVLAADLARDDWERDPVFLPLVADSLALQTVYFLRQVGPTSLGPLDFDTFRALQLAGSFFGANRGAELRARARTLLVRALQTQVGPDGGYIGLQPVAQMGAAWTVTEFLLLDQGEDAPATLWLREKLQQILEILEGMLLPDGSLPLFGRAAGPETNQLSDLFALAAVLLDEPRWKNLAGRFGIIPYMWLGEAGKDHFERLPHQAWKAEHRLQSHSALFRLSGREESALVINGQFPTAPGQHHDFMSFELFLQGQRVIVDSGAYSPEGESWDAYFAGWRAHNVFLVDGQGPRWGAVDGTAAEPLKPKLGPACAGLRLPNGGFGFLGLNHARLWFCLDERYWVILDRLEGGGSHHGISLLHFYPTFQIELAHDRAIARSRSSSVTVIPLSPRPANMVAARGWHPEFPGWYAPDYGSRYPASVLAFDWADLQLPWVGGHLIVPGTDTGFRADEADLGGSVLSFELAGTRFRLPTG